MGKVLATARNINGTSLRNLTSLTATFEGVSYSTMCVPRSSALVLESAVSLLFYSTCDTVKQHHPEMLPRTGPIAED